MNRTTITKVLLWLGCLTPVSLLGYRAYTGRLSANPIEDILHFLGLWGLILLLSTLAVTPLRRLTGANWLIKLRRPLGLFAFFYVCLHFTTYLWLDQWFEWEFIVEDITERPYIIVGFTAFLLLIPLAVTSTRGWIRRMGRWWQRLHSLVYVAAALGVFHFLWLVKADTREPAIYGMVLVALLAARLRPKRKAAKRRDVARRPATAGTAAPATEGT